MTWHLRSIWVLSTSISNCTSWFRLFYTNSYLFIGFYLTFWNFFKIIPNFYLKFCPWKYHHLEKNPDSLHFLGCKDQNFMVRRCRRYRRTHPINHFSATQLTFLPFKLEPLGFSLTGQLRVASQFIFIILHLKILCITL